MAHDCSCYCLTFNTAIIPKQSNPLNRGSASICIILRHVKIRLAVRREWLWNISNREDVEKRSEERGEGGRTSAPQR